MEFNKSTVLILLIIIIDVKATQQPNILEENTHIYTDVNKMDELMAKNDEPKPTKRQIRFGDQVLKDIWKFCELMITEIDKLDKGLQQLEDDLKTTTYHLLDKRIEPSRNLIEHGGNCDPKVSSKLDNFMNNQKLSITHCRRMDEPKYKFKNHVQFAKQFLDEFQVQITKEISMCEVMNRENSQLCYEESFDHAQDDKMKFIMGQYAQMEREAFEMRDEIEGHWLGCSMRALGDVKKANKILEKKLKCCQKNIYRSPCNNLQNVFDKALSFRQYETDMDAYYLQAKKIGN